MTTELPTTAQATRSSRRADGRVLLGLAARAMRPYRPVMAHLVVTRRCNLSCSYCYEADRVSLPVPTAELELRIDHLQRLDTLFVTLTGGEPLLHPDLVALVAYVRAAGMIPVMNSNGFLLTEELVAALNQAGLYAMQISVDNLEPDSTSQKSLRPLLGKLELLAAQARFRVRVNTVLGANNGAEAVAVARAVVALGFDAKCSLVRDDKGALVPLDDSGRAAYDELRRLGRRASSLLSEDFQLPLAREGRVEWKCRSGARYFMVCEQGLVHLCESSHGFPGTPLADYGREDIRRAFHAPKSCAPTCAVAYAHQASRLDNLRGQHDAELDIAKECWASCR